VVIIVKSNILQGSKNYANAESILRKLKWHGEPKHDENNTAEPFKTIACRNSLQVRHSFNFCVYSKTMKMFFQTSYNTLQGIKLRIFLCAFLVF